MCLSGPILVTEVRYGGQLGRLRGRWGTFGSVPTNFGSLPNVEGQQGVSSRTTWEYWQGASVAGKVPKNMFHF